MQQNGVFVSSLDRRVTEDFLREQFRLCGRITSVRLVKDQKGMSKGYGYIFFHDSKGQQHAIGRNKMKIGNKKIMVAKIGGKKAMTKTTTQKSVVGKKSNEDRKEAKEHRRKNLHSRTNRAKQQRMVNMGFLTRDQKIQMFENQSRAFGEMHHYTGRKPHKDFGGEIKEWTESTKLYVQSLRKFDEYNNSFGEYLASVKKTQDAMFDLCLALQDEKHIEIKLKALKENNSRFEFDELGKVVVKEMQNSNLKGIKPRGRVLLKKGLKKLKENGIVQKKLKRIKTTLRKKTRISTGSPIVKSSVKTLS